jgi:hypothetical protein
MNEFILDPDETFIWNKVEFLNFLSTNQGQDILINTNSEGCCLEVSGVYEILDQFKFNSVRITTSNLLENHSRYIIEIVNAYKFLTGGNYNKYHNWNKQKIFGAMYGRPKWHRIGITAHLYTKYSQESLLNFRLNPHIEDQRILFDLQTLFNFSPESAKLFLSIYDQLPLLIEQQDSYTTGATTHQHTDQLASHYPDFLIDIVSETFTKGKTLFITEKTVRPMLLKKPFIVMGSRNFLAYLKQMGFKTFDKYWDEGYDFYEGKDRYLNILKLIDLVASKSISDLNKIYEDMQEILDHNYNLLHNQSFIKKIEYIND